MFLSIIIRLVLALLVGVILFAFIYGTSSDKISSQADLLKMALIILFPAYVIGFNFIGDIALTTLSTREDNVVVARVISKKTEKKKKGSSSWVKRYHLKIMKGENEKDVSCEFKSYKDTIFTPGNENFKLVVPTYKLGNSVVLEDYCGALLK